MPPSFKSVIPVMESIQNVITSYPKLQNFREYKFCITGCLLAGIFTSTLLKEPH